MFGKKDELGFVLCGTKGMYLLQCMGYLRVRIETENALADNGGYEHITVAREITTPDLDLLRYIEKIVPGKHEGDCILRKSIPLYCLTILSNRRTSGGFRYAQQKDGTKEISKAYFPCY